MEGNKIHHGDCLEVMQGMEENSVDAVVCDPPYELTSIVKRFGKKGAAPAKPGTDGRYARLSRGFMGKEWDGTGVGMRPEVWRECLRIAKPGAYLLAFGGTRTFHRLACAVEDAGWILRDTMMWCYGSGFPKSHDASKALDRKAGVEREVVGKNPTYRKDQDDAPSFSLQRNPNLTAPATPEAKYWDGWGTALKPAWEPILLFQKPIEGALHSEIHGITGWRRWHMTIPKKAWTGKAEDEKSWKQSQCYKRCKKYGLEWWEKEAEEGKVERWIFERRWLALEPKTQGRHVIIGKNKRVVLKRIKYKDRIVKNTAANIIKWRCGALNIEACMIRYSSKDDLEESLAKNPGKKDAFTSGVYGKDRPQQSVNTQGRWPANFLLSHTIFCKKTGEREVEGYAINRFTDGAKPFGGGAGHPYESEKQGKQMEEIWECVPECPVRMLDAQSGETVTRPHGGKGERLDTQKAGWGFRRMPSTLSDRGGASRFFYCAKVSRREKKAGLSAEHNLFIRREEKRLNHPTIKPIALMRYLCRLVTPPNGVVLDPFLGSGSTGCAAALEGFPFVGVEKEKEYIEIARAKLAYWEGKV